MRILCDDVLNYEEKRAHIDRYKEYMVLIEPDISTGVASANAPILFHATYVKNPTFKEREAKDIWKGNVGKLF